MSHIDFEGSPKEPLPGKFIAIGSLLSQPLSRGSVHSSSGDPDAKPLIDPKLVSHPFDLELLAHQMSYIPQIAEMEPLKPTIFKEGGRRWDPKSNFKTLDDVKDFVRTSGASMWHPTSTCSMLPKDLGGVVNERLLVYGTSNLRVVDASIMPLIPVANIQSSVYAVAERASDIIKIDNGLKIME
jgi:choline dehydrogenase-like flavoprotein